MVSTEALSAYWNLLLNNIAWANVGDASGLQPSATDGFLYVSLHTDALSAGSSQNTNEAAYTNYARVAVARDPLSPKWTVSGANASNVSQIAFPQAASGETELYWGVGTDETGAGHLLYGGPISAHFYGFTAATNDDITVPGNAFNVDDRIAFYPEWSDFTFPTGITAGQLYYVLTVTGDVITISATSGGAAVNVSAAGAGICAVVTPFVITSLDTPAIAASQAVLLGV